MRILVIDAGGTHVKLLATGRKQRVEFPSGPKMTPAKMVTAIRVVIGITDPQCEDSRHHFSDAALVAQ